MINYTNANTSTTFIEFGRQVYPCRCGVTHRGDFAAYDFAHHECFHTSQPLKWLDEQHDQMICGDCGQVFNVET